MNESVEKNGLGLGLLRSALLAKGIAETVFIGALALIFYLTAFPPSFRGTIDVTNSKQIAGWVVNSQSPENPVEVQIYIDGKFVAHIFANFPREDVQAAGFAPNIFHGFVYSVPPELETGDHEARVYVLHASDEGARQTLQLLDTPKKFNR